MGRSADSSAEKQEKQRDLPTAGAGVCPFSMMSPFSIEVLKGSFQGVKIRRCSIFGSKPSAKRLPTDSQYDIAPKNHQETLNPKPRRRKRQGILGRFLDVFGMILV